MARRQPTSLQFRLLLYSILGAVALLLVAAAVFLPQASSVQGYIPNLVTEILGIALTVAVVDLLLQRAERARRASLETEERLDIGLACHTWKSFFISLFPQTGVLAVAPGGDVWDAMEAAAPRRYSIEEWMRCRPLFEQGLEQVAIRLRTALSLGTVVPDMLRAKTLAALRQLSAEQMVYGAFPTLPGEPAMNDASFRARFTEVVRLLRDLDHTSLSA